MKIISPKWHDTQLSFTQVTEEKQVFGNTQFPQALTHAVPLSWFFHCTQGGDNALHFSVSIMYGDRNQIGISLKSCTSIGDAIRLNDVDRIKKDRRSSIANTANQFVLSLEQRLSVGIVRVVATLPMSDLIKNFFRYRQNVQKIQNKIMATREEGIAHRSRVFTVRRWYQTNGIHLTSNKCGIPTSDPPIVTRKIIQIKTCRSWRSWRQRLP